MGIRIIITAILLLFSHNVLACKCVNPDVHDVFSRSDMVVLAAPVKEFRNSKQRFSVRQLIKGEFPQAGLFLDQIKTSCPFLPSSLSYEQKYLLFIAKAEDGYKLASHCYNYVVDDKGIFTLRMNNVDVDIHHSMLASFFKRQGKVPKIKIYTSHKSNEGKIENWLSITNLEDEEIEVFHPSNRQAFTFFVIDQFGNVVKPKGSAKVSPKGGVLTIPAGGVYNHEILPSSNLHFPYLSGTAQFGYLLEKDQKYRMHMVYRPFGGVYGATFSKEKPVKR